MREPKQYVRCPECGSTDVERDALCRWNVETQEWEIASVLDSSTCGHCGYESNVFDWVNKYTTEQVECRAYAATLRQQGEQAGGVPDGFFTDLQQAKNTAERSSKIDRLRVYGRVVEKHINALLAAAPSQPKESK